MWDLFYCNGGDEMSKVWAVGDVYFELNGDFLDVRVVETYDNGEVVSRFVADGSIRLYDLDFWEMLRDVLKLVLDRPYGGKLLPVYEALDELLKRFKR